MASADSSLTPTAARGDDLMICPVCFGHTKLLGENVYCPNCGMIISSNLSDTMKTKVALIKEQVTMNKEAADYQKQQKYAWVRKTMVIVVLCIGAIVLFLLGITLYNVIQGVTYEHTGDYMLASDAYQRSEWLVPLPGIKSSITRVDTLAYSTQQYQLGQQAFAKKDWQAAAAYFARVLPTDKHYQDATAGLQMAQYHIAHP